MDDPAMNVGETWLLSLEGIPVGFCLVQEVVHPGDVVVQLTWKHPLPEITSLRIMDALAQATADLAFAVMEDCERRLATEALSLALGDQRWVLGTHLSGLVWLPEDARLSFRLLPAPTSDVSILLERGG